MALDWSRLARSKPNIQLSTRAWHDAKDEQDSNHRAIPGTRKNPPEQADNFKLLFGSGKRPKLNLGHWAPPIRASMWGGDTNPGRVPGPMRHLPQQHPRHELPQAHAGAHASDLALMLVAMMQAQTDGQIAVAAANTANLIMFTTAMAQALATLAGSKKASKLTLASKVVLQACTGEGDLEGFAPPPVFAAMATDGGTVDALGLTLRRLLQPNGINAHHRT
jgi:hypothetical protein